MTKKEKREYQRKIERIAEKLLIDANKEAWRVTEDVFADILKVMRERIDEILARKDNQRRKEEGNDGV